MVISPALIAALVERIAGNEVLLRLEGASLKAKSAVELQEGESLLLLPEEKAGSMALRIIARLDSKEADRIGKLLQSVQLDFPKEKLPLLQMLTEHNIAFTKENLEAFFHFLTQHNSFQEDVVHTFLFFLKHGTVLNHQEALSLAQSLHQEMSQERLRSFFDHARPLLPFFLPWTGEAGRERVVFRFDGKRGEQTGGSSFRLFLTLSKEKIALLGFYQKPRLYLHGMVEKEATRTELLRQVERLRKQLHTVGSQLISLEVHTRKEITPSVFLLEREEKSLPQVFATG